MNQQIRELAEQCGFNFDEYNLVLQRKLELFAELLYSELMLVDSSCHERGCMALDCNATPVMVLGVRAKP